MTTDPVKTTSRSRSPWVLAGILGLVTCNAFETIAVVSVMPVVADDLDAVKHYGLMFSFFMTASLVGTVGGGSWCDLRGPRWPTITGFVLFAVGLALCGLATTFPVMLAGRLISGAGAGLFIVALYVVLARVYEDAERLRVFGYLSAAWVLPSLIGPAVAGWLAQEISWRAVFLAVPPIGLAALLMMLPALAASSSGRAPDADVVEDRQRLFAGLGLGAGVGLVQWYSQKVTDDPSAWLGVALGTVLLVPAVLALLPAGVFRLARGLPAIIGLRGLFTCSFFAAEAYVPLALMSERGFSTFHGGLALTAASVSWAGASWLQGRFAPPPRVAISVGAAGIAVALLGAATIFTFDLSGWWVLLAWSFGGFGMGLSQPALSTQTLKLAESGQEGRASAALQISDVLGTVLGMAVTGAVFAALHRPGHDAGLFSAMWLALGGLAVLTAVLGGVRVTS